MQHVILYKKENCPLCDDAEALLDLLKHDYSFEVEERDIHSNDDWLEAYQLSIPVVHIGETELDASEITYGMLEHALKVQK